MIENSEEWNEEKREIKTIIIDDNKLIFDDKKKLVIILFRTIMNQL